MSDDTRILRMQQSLDNARRHLLSLRNEQGFWEGHLASSALSTATAVCVFDRLAKIVESPNAMEPQRAGELAQAGRNWLAEHQNEDGGWGDTTDSLSNISTTALCWCAFAGDEATQPQTVATAENWLRRKAGSLEPGPLSQAIKQRYGRDHTFSVPILTTMALTGRLGSGPQCWKIVPQLPFELAAFPRDWFAMLQLPVVSYALPALIAIGLVRHDNHPSRNPLARMARIALRRRVLGVLEQIQPTSGGFLEATPLTSFVTLGLLGADEFNSPVVRNGVEFLEQSCRADGSWPIDTNLATWVSTLSVGAMQQGDDHSSVQLSNDEKQTLAEWLLSQQYTSRHPYTNASPGGWAWTDLPGGVPDADDTPGALLTLQTLGCDHQQALTAATAAVGWLLDLQNSDGGMPTFCRGWGKLPFDRSSCDITAHGLRAWHAWRQHLPPAEQSRMAKAQQQAMGFLARSQRSDGAWPPLWFGNQYATDVDETNLTYGTSRVLLALAELHTTDEGHDDSSYKWREHATQWLSLAQNTDGGWGGAVGVRSSVEETAFALEALCAVVEVSKERGIQDSIRRGVDWLIEATKEGTDFPTTPVGFYFAKLWYYEQLYPVIYTVAALGRAAQVLASAPEEALEGVR
ncbi:squalene--hopene cyclase [Aeoliella sp. ICT_H6.2]|uniref:Squalene--hopene cyclase n=1 Tax=Aeoliella straminimaris TaxID=2954799 RepID=A0A9X2FB63_9BACT|nr:prenyltransferase/squalene oxidase repeat-containing protein [Aeoliella straminimaris]MCO6042831.1 squalene--hopene cyclase [Aeoliella straminimaris]